jgi:hypothetical protein
MANGPVAMPATKLAPTLTASQPGRRLEGPDRPGHRDLAHRTRPGLGQGHQGRRGRERHLKAGRPRRLGLDQQDDQGRHRQAVQGDGLAVEQDGGEGHRGGDRRPQGRRRRAGDHQIGPDGGQARQGGDLLARNPQRRPRPGGDQQAHQAEREAADDGHVQARDRQDVGQARGAHGVGLFLGDPGLVAGDHGRGDPAALDAHVARRSGWPAASGRR